MRTRKRQAKHALSRTIRPARIVGRAVSPANGWDERPVAPGAAGEARERATPPMSWGAFVLAIVAAGLPTLIYLALVWWLDRYEKEPAHLLAVTFLWGALPAALLAVTLDLALN